MTGSAPDGPRARFRPKDRAGGIIAPMLLAVLLVAPARAAAQQFVDAAATIIEVAPGGDATERLQEALIMVPEGGTVRLLAGRYEITRGLSLDVPRVTVEGAGMDATVLTFAGQEAGSEGLMVTADDVTLKDFAIEDTKGDAVKAKGVRNISFIRLRTEWTGGPKPTNGSYGLYPVESENVLIDGCVAIGASDAGIYVGQSRHIVVRNSRAERNVAGIEIENSFFADVHDNLATHNTGGILVFDLPNLPQQGGHDIRVFRNRVVDNDEPNFAPPGNIVANVPRGAGLMIMANRRVEVFANVFRGNATADVLVVSYPFEYDDPHYDPHPTAVFIHDNDFAAPVFAPEGRLAGLLKERLGEEGANIVFDGVMPFLDALFGRAPEEGIMIREAPDVRFANLRMIWAKLLPWRVAVDRDAARYRGSGRLEPPIAAVTLPQDAAPAGR
ncbi:MAG: hypothetical protein KatS3mg119_2202 [Rhodothalassiaceae bacterium]|nr:MAG: hypothetical protein KatS3mg119_2202 [Rhodothalassiaceae bacterium]